MKLLKNKRLVNLFLVLANILLAIFIIKECKILGFCYTIITLISPVFFGYGIAWLIKPIMLYLNKYFKEIISAALTYAFIIIIIALISYFTIPVIVKEVKHLIPEIMQMYKDLDPLITDNIDLNAFGNKVISTLNKYTVNAKDFILNIFYSAFISFFFLTNHREVSRFLAKKIPHKLIYELSINLKAFVRGTLIDTIVLFILSIIGFYVAGLPYAFLFAIVISITNLIPFIGPYIGGIPAIIVAFSVSNSLGFIIIGIVVFMQVIESTFIYPYIMSKSVEINGVLIMLSLIVCGYFLGVFGMLLSTPIISVIKTLYEYHKEHPLFNLKVLGK